MKGPGNMRRAEEFNALLDGRATDADAERYAALLDVVGALRDVPPVEARPAFVADLRSQLVAAAERQEVREVDEATARRLTPTQRRGVGERRFAAALGGFAVVAATGSMAMASQSALPGDVLYPVKRALENAQTNLESDEAARAESLLAHAESRLAEIEELAARGESGDADAISETLQDFQDQSNQAAAITLEEYGANGDRDGVSELRSFSGRSLERLTSLSDTLPEESRPALVSAAQNLTQIDQAAFDQCPECSVESLIELPEFAIRSLAAALDTSEAVETLPDMPQISDKDLAKGEKAAERSKRSQSADPTTDATADPSADPTLAGEDPTDGLVDRIKDKSAEGEESTGLISDTVRKLTKSLGLDNDKTASDEDSPTLIGTLTDLLGLTE